MGKQKLFQKILEDRKAIALAFKNKTPLKKLAKERNIIFVSPLG